MSGFKHGTIKTCILEYLQKEGASWGGQVEEYLRSLLGTKGGTTSRRLRELVEEQKIQVCYKQVNGSGPHVARYRIKP